MHEIRNRVRLVFAAVVLAAAGVGLFSWQQTVIGQEDPQSESAAAAVAHAEGLSKAFRNAAQRATPSVVKIISHTKSKQIKLRGDRGGDAPEGFPFDELLPKGFKLPDELREFRRMIPERDGVGSGVIIDSSGIVLTNNHVVDGADEIVVRLSDGREFKATDIKTDPETDLAVIRLKNAGTLPAAKLGNSDELEIGDWVIAIGNPFNLDSTVSAGIVSGKGRGLDTVRRAQFLQTDAAINPGNSGGPLVNLKGEVVGINTAIATNNGAYQGIGYAIPANLARWVTDQLVKTGSVARGFLGVGIGEISPELAAKFGVRSGEGVLVSELHPKTPAAEAGLEEGDVILAFNGREVNNPRELQEAVEQAPLDSKQPVSILRGGNRQKVDVVIRALPEKLVSLSRESGEQASPATADSFHAEKLGLEVSDLAGEAAEQYAGHQGVLISRVDEDSLAARKGLRAGMLIRKVGKTPVVDSKQFAEAIEKESVKEGVLLQVRTPAGNRYVVLQAD